MMDEPLDELYIQWLYSQVASIRFKNPARTYWSLIRQLFTKEFVWFVPNDDNRVEDGRDLRNEFIEQHELDVDPEWMDMGCSMLEMLIGLARRLSFETEGSPRDWFWILMTNLDLHDCNDHEYKRTRNLEERVSEIIDTVIWRTYKRNGEGGLFPLSNSRKDQRWVELWYQMSYYLLERE